MYNWFRRNFIFVPFFSLIGIFASVLTAFILKNNVLEAVSILSIPVFIIVITLIHVFVFPLDKYYDLEFYFQEKQKLLRFANKKTRRKYEKIIFKYDSLYKKIRKSDEPSFLEKMERLFAPALEEAQKNKECRRKKREQKQIKSFEVFEKVYENDKSMLQPVLKIDK